MATEAEVLFDYEKTQDDEISLQVGQIIRDVIAVDEGWCEGTVNGIRGLFPDNFVKLRKASPAPAPAPADTLNNLGAPPLRDPSKNKGRRAKVTYSYAAENADELTLQPGQFVEILEEEEEGWWRGRSDDGKMGLFPSNFVEETVTEDHDGGGVGGVGGGQAVVVDNTQKEEKPPAPTPASEHPRQSVLGLKLPTFNPAAAKANLKKTKAPPPAKPEEKKPVPSLPAHPKAPEKPPEKQLERAKVTFDYTAEQADELSIKFGDVVEVLKKDQEGWWEVRLGERTGMIPDNFVEVLPAQQTSAPPTRPPAPSIAESKPEAPPPFRPEAPPPSKPEHPPPPSKEPTPSKPSPFKKPPEPKRPHPPPPGIETDDKDFGVPDTTPLDSSAVKTRAKKPVGRPPSRSNLHHLLEDNIARPHEEPPPSKPQPPSEEGSKLSPWQQELQKRRSGKVPTPRPPPKTAVKPSPPPGPKAAVRPPAPDPDAKPTRTASTSGKPPFSAKPPPTVKPEIKTPPPARPAEVKASPPKPAEVKAPPPAKPAEVKVQSSPVHSPAHHPAPPSEPAATERGGASADAAWKEAFEKLRKDFEKFKEDCKRDMQILTDDLDKERKARAMLEVDIDRLKKTRDLR